MLVFNEYMLKRISNTSNVNSYYSNQDMYTNALDLTYKLFTCDDVFPFKF